MPKRVFSRKVYKKDKRKEIISLVLKLSVLALIAAPVVMVFLFLYYSKDLPRPEKFTEKTFVESTKIYDRTGKVLLFEMYGEEKRETVPLDSVSDYLKKAVISVEDANFYSHYGIDITGIFRAIKTDIIIGKPAFGGSTISQQLIRSTFLTPEKTIKRKIREIILTLELERKYSKDQILEWYLNQIPFGPNLYGVETASKAYFEKSAKDLSLNEAAALAAVIQAPSYFSPYGPNKEELVNRKNYVLERMNQEGYITKEELESAKAQELAFSESVGSIKAPHFVFYIQNYLLENYGKDMLEKGGLNIYTSLDWELQETAEKAVLEGVEKNKNYKVNNAALVAIDPKTGEVLAMVGSKNWFGDPYPEGCTSGKDCLFDPKVNVATYNIGRQPGSSFKPFVYATAFSKGYDDKYVVVDEETNFGIFGGKPYIPRNYDGKFRGPVTLRQALAQSLNIPAVKTLAYLAGQKDSIETAKKLGITTLNKPYSYYGLSIVLGGGEVKLLDMVSAYGVFATEGYRIPPVSVLRIEDSKGNILEQNNKISKMVLEKRSAVILNSILSDNDARAPMFGYNSLLYFKDYQVAVKTGTTDDFKDGWIIGYTPSVVLGVWVGNNNNVSMSKEPGVVLAGPIWRSVMSYILPKLPRENFTPIETIEPQKTDSEIIEEIETNP
ncbi:MAG: PBP1A family penicillin-binding protein [Candidatus Pacebacteria bacterium]|nr:PBP1A family penicillin-binding protein [Candidatus Paceibacterota bacterium]